MDTSDVERRKREIVERYGEWKGENLQLIGDVYTGGKDAEFKPYRLRRIVQAIADAHGSTNGLRVLDLACFEGAFSIEFALRGCDVVGVEGRETNLAKARFAQEVLGLSNLRFVQADVRDVRSAGLGEFDVVICSGILYHLDVPDVFALLEYVVSATRRYAIVDTRTSLHPVERVTYRDRDYCGVLYQEYERQPSREEEELSVLSSIGNVRSFWLTKPSLLNFLSEIGFTSVYECHVPEMSSAPRDRVTLLAIKGEPQELVCSPVARNYPSRRYDEEPPEAAPRQRRTLERTDGAQPPLT